MQSGKTPQVSDPYAGLQTPDVNAMKLQLEDLVQQGILQPEQAQAFLADPSAMANIQTDPDLQSAQMDALSSLQDIGSSGGMNTADRANLSRIGTDEATKERGAREAILQHAQERGAGGSGAELLAQLQNQQDSASRQSQRDLDVAGMAQQRALQALAQGGTLAGNIQGQQFSQQAQQAQAQDAISKFNAQNQQQVNQANVGANNAAQAANLNAQQGIANQNVAQHNAQQQYNKSLAQQNYENQLKKAGGSAGVAEANAANAGKDSQGAADAFNKTIGAGITAGGQVGSAFAGKPSSGYKEGGLVGGHPSNFDSQMTPTQPGEFVIRKEDVPDALKKIHTKDNGEFDVSGFLDSITGHKYGYSKGKK